MKINRLTEIARKVYFSESGCIDWNEVETKYGLSKMELNHVINIIRNWNGK